MCIQLVLELYAIRKYSTTVPGNYEGLTLTLLFDIIHF